MLACFFLYISDAFLMDKMSWNQPEYSNGFGFLGLFLILLVSYSK